MAKFAGMEMDNWGCPKIKAEIFPNCHFDQENADELQDLRPLDTPNWSSESGGPGDELATLPPQRCAEGLP